MLQNKRVLLSPLNWGMGHVARCIPLVRELLANSNEVIVCCDENQESFFKDFFPALCYVPHQGYPFEFNGEGEWEKDILKSFRKLKSRLKLEEKQVDKYCDIFKPDVIISDQRYGFRHKTVPSIFITHQLNLPTSGLYKIAQLENRFKLSKFSAIWVYDAPNGYLAGKLSCNNKGKVSYLGSKSRFNINEENILYKYTAIISGPRPYCDAFFDEVKNKFVGMNEPTVIISNSQLAKTSLKKMGKCKVLIQPKHKLMEKVLNASDCIVSRAGYTTLMDLEVLQKKAILVPTKGQKEQLYLANYHKDKSNWKFYDEVSFKNLDLSKL